MQKVKIDEQVTVMVETCHSLIAKGTLGDPHGARVPEVREMLRSGALAFEAVKIAPKVMDSLVGSAIILNQAFDSFITCVAALDALLDPSYRVEDGAGDVVMLDTTPPKGKMN